MKKKIEKFKKMNIEDSILDMVTQNTSKIEDLKRMIQELDQKIDSLKYHHPYRQNRPWIRPDITFPDSPMCQCNFSSCECHMRKY